jgi:exonuclease SbcC
MKIISVRFANLNSLPGPFLIRFDETPLADTGLFAITGPTGAGKSTLLDAIAVGLYGRVPRHDRQVGEMVSRHAKDAFSEVEFEVYETDANTGAVDRVRYRSRWEVKRKTRGEDKGGLGQDAMTLVMSPSGVAVLSGKEAVPTRVSELSGLDFGQFEQSVLLSQGKFARFLHAPEKERSALLEKMTNVGIYSRLSVAAYEKAKEEELKTKLLRARLDATRLLSEEERAELERQLDTLNETAEQHHEEEQELAICLAWRTELEQLDRQLQATTLEAERLREADASLQSDFARLDGHLRAEAVDKPLGLAEAAGKEVRYDEQQLLTSSAALPRLTQWQQRLSRTPRLPQPTPRRRPKKTACAPFSARPSRKMQPLRPRAASYS